MPDLVSPTERVHASYLVALAAFQAENLHTDLDIESMRRAPTFRRYVDALVAFADPDTPRPPGYVPEPVLWWIDGVEFLGRLAIRHYLTAALTRIGGHIA